MFHEKLFKNTSVKRKKELCKNMKGQMFLTFQNLVISVKLISSEDRRMIKNFRVWF